MSNNDKKTVIILTVLYKLIDFHYKENDKKVLLHRIQLIINEYKTGLRRYERSYINFTVNKFGIKIEESKVDDHPAFLLSLVFMVSEHFRILLKNPRRVVAWESLENFLSKNSFLSCQRFLNFYDDAEKIKDLLINDDLY